MGFKAVLSTGFLLAIATGVVAEPERTYPEDPFAWERKQPLQQQLGTAAGQVKFSALGGFVISGNSDDEYLIGQLSTEKVLNEFVGLRGSAYQELQNQDDDLLDFKMSSLRFGPVYHLMPYRQLDIGAFFEGGVVIVDMFDGGSDKGPEVAMGGFITWHFDTYFFLQMELQRSWANLEIEDVQGSHNRTFSMLGLGVSF